MEIIAAGLEMGQTLNINWDHRGPLSTFLESRGLNIGDVAKDLSKGFLAYKVTGDTAGPESYEIQGSKFVCQLSPGIGKKNSKPIAILYGLRSNPHVLPKKALLKASIDFLPLAAEQPCDLKQIFCSGLDSVPQPWAEEFAGVAPPNASSFHLDLDEPLPLSWTHLGKFAGKLHAENLTKSDLEDDLSDGFHVDRQPDRNISSEYVYWLTGSKYRILVKPVRSRTNPNVLMTKCIDFTVNRSPSIRDVIRPSRVSINPESGQLSCNIEEFYRKFTEWRRSKTEYAKRCEKSLWRLSTTDKGKTLLRKEESHREALRRYGALRSAYRLLKSRQKKAVREFFGTVAESAGSEEGEEESRIVISLDRSQNYLSEKQLVKISLVDDRDRKVRTRLLEVQENAIVIEKPEDLDLPAGTRVRIKESARFPNWAAEESLNKFLREEISGDWDNLLSLLCSPDRLPPFQHSDPPFYYSEISRDNSHSLNREQKAAVAGAISTPHAFFIQGPPGTGKTTTIHELVRQLTGRGERVLLLAPTHVAIDELLVRISREKDHVIPIRLSWNESKISREEARRFTEAELIPNLIGDMRTPATSKKKTWQTEIKRLSDLSSILSKWITARADAFRQKGILEESENVRSRSSKDYTLKLDKLHSDFNEQVKIEKDSEWIAGKTSKDLQAANAKYKKLDSETKGIGKLLSGLGIGKLPSLKRAIARHEQDLRAARATAGKSNRQQKAIADKILKLKSGHRSALTKLDAEIARGRDEATVAWDEYERVLKEALRVAGTGEDELVRLLEDSSGRISKLMNYIELEDRWFAVSRKLLSETGGGSDLADLIIQNTNLVCATTTGIAGAPLTRNLEFDTLILDEASRVTDPEFLIGATRARRWILVGDEHQLPPYVEQDNEHFLHALSVLHAVDLGYDETLEAAAGRLGQLWREDEELRQYRESAVVDLAARLKEEGKWESYSRDFSSAYSYFPEKGADADREFLLTIIRFFIRSLFERCVSSINRDTRQRLQVQRRMIPAIAELVRDPVYDREYTDPPPEELRAAGLVPFALEVFQKPIVFLDTSSHVKKCGEQLKGTGFVNELEADWAVSVCRQIEVALAREKQRATVSILAFYRAQSLLISWKLGIRRIHFPHVEFEVVDAIDKIQGQESDIVIISFCRAQPGRKGSSTAFARWLKDYRRLNVATTRAHRGLFMVGHLPTIKSLNFAEEEEKAEKFYSNLTRNLDRIDHPDMVRVHDFRPGR